MSDINQGFPGVPQSPMTTPNGTPTPVWLQFFLSLWARTGSASGSISGLLDSLSSTVGSMLVRGGAAWQGIAPGANNAVLKMIGTLPGWGFLDGNSFGVKSAATFFAGPASGANQIPVFRALVSSDLPAIPPASLPAGQYPGTVTNDNASAGNVGEYLSSSIPVGSAVPLTTTVPADITTLLLGPGDYDVWGNIAVTAATTLASGWINSASATDPGAPNNGVYGQLSGANLVTPIGMMRVTVAALSTVTLSLSIQAAFAGSVSAYGFIGARRAR